MESLHDRYKMDKWNLYFGNNEINKCKGTFILYVVDKSLTFEDWIQNEEKSSVFTYGYFRCEWRKNA